MIRPNLVRLATLGALLFSARLLSAQTVPAARPITRADLAASYLRLDRVLSTARLSDTTRASVNRSFDQATLSFFMGRFAVAVTTIDSLTRVVAPGEAQAAIAAAPRRVNGAPPSQLQASLLLRIARLDTMGPLHQAVVSVRARTQLLVDVPNPERSAEFLSDPAELGKSLIGEVQMLERGIDPYRHAAGDRWRAFEGTAGAPIPFRIVATPAVARSTKPVPLLLVFHGAGGDENMFVDAYGAGITAKLAAENGMLLVSIATVPFAANLANFDTLLALLRTEYVVDSNRVYVLGHSMGSAMSARLAQERPSKIAAAVCLAGGSAVTVAGAPPVFFMAGALDPIAPPAVVAAAAAKSPSGEFHLAPNEGHTLMVATGVKAAIPWLLARHR